MSKQDPLGIVKNGHEVPVMRINPAARCYPVTPDGSQWEVRIHMMSDLSKLVEGAPPAGEEIIGEVIIRSYNGGLAPLVPMADEAATMCKKVVQQVMKAIAAAQKQMAPPGVEIVTELPPNLKGS